MPADILFSINKSLKIASIFMVNNKHNIQGKKIEAFYESSNQKIIIALNKDIEIILKDGVLCDIIETNALQASFQWFLFNIKDGCIISTHDLFLTNKKEAISSV